MAEVNYEDHYVSKIGKQTMIMLISYQNSGIFSRAFMLKEHAAHLEKIRLKQDGYEKYNDNQLLLFETCIYQELVENLCHLIEDFSILCYALWDDLADFTARMISQPNPKNILRELGSQHWITILRYPDLASLNLEEQDKVFMQQHYDKNISVVQRFVSLLKKYIDLYWTFFNKRKHGNTLLYGIEKVKIKGEQTLLLPIAYNRKKPEKYKLVPFNYSMYKQNQILFNNLATLIQDILNRTILFIQRNGVCLLDYASYYKMTEENKEKVNKLIEEHNISVRQAKINVRMRFNIENKVLTPFYEFYEDFDIGAFS